MNKKLKVILNTIAVLLIFGSIFWGFVVQHINCWFETECGTEQTGYWPIVFMLYIPILLIIALVIINTRKSSK